MRTNYPEPEIQIPATYSITQFAEKVGISRPLAYKLVRAGAIKIIRIGPVMRITQAEAERVAREGTDAQAVAA